MAKRVKIETEEDSELRRRLSQPPASQTPGSEQNPLLDGLMNVDSLSASLGPDINQFLLAMLQQSLQTIVSMQAATQNTTSHTMWEATQQTPIELTRVTQGSKQTPEKNCASLSDEEDPVSRAKRLTTPKISKSHHNDAAYYPNIQCILCKEWVCSRNRFMHVESHLQYRPYKCSVCGYDNRKEIFINLHIKKAHGGEAEVVYQPDADLEHRAWIISENCIQHTREVLSKGIRPESGNQAHGIEAPDVPSHLQSCPTGSKELQSELVDPLRYRPRIFNSQRAEKTQIIEESRVKGLIPDFSEISSRETKCELCDVHVLSSGPIMEEHSRVHLSKASYM
ncbi:zinc finger protein [Aphelenchoides avenae]|nr:zinc finger protein [Aphelenchus avenae]